LRLSKLISKRALTCAHCSEEIPVGEEYVSVGGPSNETQGLSGRLHVPCFIHLLHRLPPKQ
jgi:hypothetical protein